MQGQLIQYLIKIVYMFSLKIVTFSLIIIGTYTAYNWFMYAVFVVSANNKRKLFT